MSTTRVIKVFLASSITELHDEREKLSTYLAGNDLRNLFRADNIEIQLVRCEDFFSGNNVEDPQEVINRELKSCDISVFLYKTKAGNRTKMEFEVARESKGQEVIVYCVDMPQKERKKSLKDLLKRLDNEGPDWRTFSHIGEVEAQLIVALLNFERKLLAQLGERYEDNEQSRQFRTALEGTEKGLDDLGGKYDLNEKQHAKLTLEIHRKIEDLMSEIGTVINDTSLPIASRIYRTIELYKKADLWASKTDYDREKYADLLFDYASFLYDYGIYRDSEAVYLRQIPLAEELYGNQHEDTATSYNEIGLVYWKQGNYPKALEYYFKALEIREKKLGKGHSDTAESYNNIGAVYDDQGDYPKALEYFFKALEIRENKLGKDHPDTASSYNNIGSLYYHQGDYPKALEYLNKALVIVEKKLGPNHPNTQTVKKWIDLVHEAMGESPTDHSFFQRFKSFFK